MEATTQLSDIIALGKRLVTELDSEESGDTLSHWMAHHIADLIQRLGTPALTGRLELEAECRRAILDLWTHRSTFNRSSRPFATLERLLHTLEALDPDNASFFYFRELGDHVRKTDEVDHEAKQWLNLATSIDRGARTLIGYCLSRAAADATDEAAAWVDLARKVESKLDTDIKLVRIVIHNESTLKDVLPSDERTAIKGVLQRRIESIDRLAEASANLRSQLVDRIEAIDGPSSEVDAPEANDG